MIEALDYELIGLMRGALVDYPTPITVRTLTGLGMFPLSGDLSGCKPVFRYIPRRWPGLWASFVTRNAQPCRLDPKQIESFGFLPVATGEPQPALLFSCAGYDESHAILHADFFNHHANLYLFEKRS